MVDMKSVPFVLWFLSALPALAGDLVVDTTEALVDAVRNADQGTTIQVAAGIYELSAPLEVKAGTTLQGAGIEKTTITHTRDWKPTTEKLPQGEIKPHEADRDAYLIRLQDKAADISISNLTLHGPQVHGAIFAVGNKNVRLRHLRIDDVLYCGIRCYFMSESRILDCEFVGAGGKWKRGGAPGTDGGISGGAIFATWMTDTEIANNRFSYGQPDRRPGKSGGHYGVKGRGGKNIHIHHNTIGLNFSIEFPFEGADNFEIDHNILHGAVSIPKHAGGKVPESGRTYHIHHNYFTTSYAIEFVRNGVEIDHNLFDFEVEKDGGNLISGFGKAPARGPALFHNNLVSNPGRGVIWIKGRYDNLVVRNNHIIARTTVTPRDEGLFGLNGQSNFSTIKITDNIIECQGQPRPLLRTDASYEATIRNNQLTNVSDADRYENPVTQAKTGLEKQLRFQCGVNGELSVEGWRTKPTSP